MGRCLKTTAYDNSDLRMAPKTAKVRTAITSLIFLSMGQVRIPPTSSPREDVDKVVACQHQRSCKEVMLL